MPTNPADTSPPHPSGSSTSDDCPDPTQSRQIGADNTDVTLDAADSIEEEQPTADSARSTTKSGNPQDQTQSTPYSHLRTTEELKQAYLQRWERWISIWKPDETNNLTPEVFLLKRFFETYQQCAENSCGASFRRITKIKEERATRGPKLTHDDLRTLLEDDTELTILIAEKICPHAICRLGLIFDIDPEFWADYLGGTERSKRESVDAWLQHLPSMRSASEGSGRSFRGEGTHFQSIVAREVSFKNQSRDIDWKQIGLSDGNAHSGAWRTSESIASRKTTILPPRQRQDDDQKWPAVAFFYQSVSIFWYSSKGKSLGIIAVDPVERLPNALTLARPDATLSPNIYLDLSAYNYTTHWRARGHPTAQSFSDRIISEIWWKLPEFKQEAFREDTLKAVRSVLLNQWTLVHGYISRDLHSIQNKLEGVIPDFKLLQTLLKDLFLHRQHCIEYTRMIEKTPGVSEQDLEHFQKVFKETLDTIERQVNLLTTLVSINETQQSIEESHGVGRLTRIATIYLPFSTVATVLAMPGSFAPGASMFWVYWVASTVLAILIIALLPFYEWAKSFVTDKRWGISGRYRKRRSQGKEGGPNNMAREKKKEQARGGDGFLRRVRLRKKQKSSADIEAEPITSS
ncbi:hypothetical protein CC80DRAFT_141321 [Byssothecium circinans]|uniref:Cora-domain-containing protein n=1 Tax=Byssothecium circinans TaxID=147558 RepID=A0A6A5TX74_9PLEO|nr:hypothetical protein CC80DRAFT_141321 [Byssothecium circinans]